MGYLHAKSRVRRAHTADISSQSNTGHRGTWGRIFGNNDRKLATDLPLWISWNDHNPALPNTNPPKPDRLIGGWPTAVAKQYRAETSAEPTIHAGPCGGSVDLDSFALTEVPLDPSAYTPPAHHFSCKTTADGLRYRLCANTGPSCPAMGQYPLGTMVDFTCQTTGQLIGGDWSTKYV